MTQATIIAVPALFPLGQVYTTPGARDALTAARMNPGELLARHASGDWGDVPEEDRKENEFSVTHGNRLLSSYRLATSEKVWIITEADRSVTTLLLPIEY